MHEAPPLRGFFGRALADAVFTHSHDADGKLIHEYPRIQFKAIHSTAILLGIGEGSRLLERLWPEIDHATLGGEEFEVLDSSLETRPETIEACVDPITYRFATPWLALNRKNFRNYTGSRNQGFRKSELSRILVGNCLGLAKSLGIRFREQIHADGRKLTSIKTSLRGNPMVGFVGRFTVNLRLPELIGLGKSVSRGFGAVSATGQ
jgi:hypothetical protein